MTAKSFLVFLFLISSLILQAFGQNSSDQIVETPTVVIQKTDDFELSGDGSSDHWNQTEWIELTQRNTNVDADSRKTHVKILYCNTGLYVLFQSEDSLVTTRFKKDYENLWLGDVVEVFLWPDTSKTNYFEYELSPLDYELPLIVSNIEGELLSWIPFGDTYDTESGRKVRHKTSVNGGQKQNAATIDSWTAEIFIPFKLMYPLNNIFPESGTTWQGNFYRLDYDDGETQWSWSPYEGNFHDYEKFGVLKFE